MKIRIRSYFPEFAEGVAFRPVTQAESPLVDTESLYSKDGYPEHRGSREAFLQFLQQRLDQVQAYLELGEGIHAVKVVQDADWAESWKQYYEPIQVSPRLTIVPSWIEYSAKEADEQLIRLDPGSAFGTGDHPTTALCLQLLDQFLPTDARVADIGTGSGALAIGSALLGARQVDAVDIDPNAVKVARENAELNGQSERIRAEVGVLGDLEGRYDIIVANLVSDLLLELKEDFASYLQPLGLLIVSGIISERAEEIKDAYTQAGYQLFHEAEAREWSALVFIQGRKDPA